ncbi:hypothetical protein B0H17DRAFT_1145126 [Mycena rosella]|uniref:Uncharacterized protein n=1 Tax=Mycena rosella TaxID=1033263 RepID=A0AAD7CR92_MYCRO|nr:hypothetical protein B0H17DRAFT_1145126 [Mycena rosella]
MAVCNLHNLTTNKTGGDTCETVIGAMIEDRSYSEVEEEWAMPVFQPLVLACVAVLGCGRRKHDQVMPEDPAEARQASTFFQSTKRSRQGPSQNVSVGATASQSALRRPAIQAVYNTPEATADLEVLLAFLTLPPIKLLYPPSLLQVLIHPPDVVSTYYYSYTKRNSYGQGRYNHNDASPASISHQLEWPQWRPHLSSVLRILLFDTQSKHNGNTI